MTKSTADPLKSLPAPPVRLDEGTPRGNCDVDPIDATATSWMARTSPSGGWGTEPRATRHAFTLPEREIARLESTAAVRPAATDRSLHPHAMRATRRLDLLLPVADNNGRPFSSEDFLAFEDLLIALAGGFTRRGEVTGTWRSPASGQVFHDQTRAYAVTVPADVADSVVRSLSSFITDRFRQEAAWIEATPTFVAAV